MRTLTWRAWALIGVCIGLGVVAYEARGAPVAASVQAAPYFSGGKFGYVALSAPSYCPKPAKGASCPLIVNGHQNYGLSATYSLHLADGTVLTAPAGMTTDLASVPTVFWAWLPPDGPYGKAAGIHDDCFKTKGTFVWRWPGHPKATPFLGLSPGHPALTFDQCNEALRQGMVALQVPTWQRVIVFEAVQTFGRSGWGS